MKKQNYKKSILIALIFVAFSITMYWCGMNPPSDRWWNQQVNNTQVTGDNIISSQEITYDVPKWHQDSIIVSLALNEDKTIKDISVKYNSSNHESTEYMNSFDQWIKTAVIGKTIDQAKVWNINWASLTSQAFNQAIDTIQS